MAVISAVLAVLAATGGGASAASHPANGSRVSFGLSAFSGGTSIAAIGLAPREPVSGAAVRLVLSGKETAAVAALAVLRRSRGRHVLLAMVSNPISARYLPAGAGVIVAGTPKLSIAQGIYNRMGLAKPELCTWPGLRALHPGDLRVLSTKGGQLPHLPAASAIALGVRAVCGRGSTTALVKALGRCPGGTPTPSGEGCIEPQPQPQPESPGGPATPVSGETSPPRCAPCDPVPGHACPLAATAAACVASNAERTPRRPY
jgi:hypothetical protein